MFVLIVLVLYAYNIQLILEEDGEKYDAFAAVITGLISYVISVPHDSEFVGPDYRLVY